MVDITSDDLAVLHKFNQMCESHKVNPTKIVASLNYDERPRLEVEVMPQDDKERQRAEKMLSAAGFSVPDRNSEKPIVLEAKTGEADWRADFYNMMDNAIKRAPSRRIG